MELIDLYIKRNYRSIFQQVKQLWLENRIRSTPAMAAYIEQFGITRHDYKNSMVIGHDIQSQQDFYKSCLGYLIFNIDNQNFEQIEYIFRLEAVAMYELKMDDTEPLAGSAFVL